MKITTIGLDLAKNAFQVHGVDERGKAVLKKQLKRAQVLPFFADLQPCLLGMEACGGAHYWARKLAELGHTVKLVAPQFVKPYVKSNKHDAADAEAICEAVARPSMRFVPVKTVEQQAILALHRARQGFVKARTAQANQIRGLMAEFGIILPQGIHSIAQRIPDILEDGENGLPDMMRQLIERLSVNLKELSRQARSVKPGSRLGTEKTKPVDVWQISPALVRSRRALWSPLSVMPSALPTAGNWPPGWGLFPDRAPLAENRNSSASANGAMPTCVRYSSTGLAPSSVSPSVRPTSTRTGSIE